MKIAGADYLQRLVPTGNFSAKMVFNDQGAFVFSARYQHRDMKVPAFPTTTMLVGTPSRRCSSPELSRSDSILASTTTGSWGSCESCWLRPNLP